MMNILSDERRINDGTWNLGSAGPAGPRRRAHALHAETRHGQGVAVLRRGGSARRTHLAGHLPHRRSRAAGRLLRGFGVRAFTSLVYPHKPAMAAWLNQWAAQFAARHPGLPATATFYPEPGCAGLRRRRHRCRRPRVQGARPGRRLRPERSAAGRRVGHARRRRIPVVIHCGSGPQPGVHTGPDPIRACWPDTPACG